MADEPATVRQKRRIDFATKALLVALGLGVTSCIPWPPAAWSPDGRRLAFTDISGIRIAEGPTFDSRWVYRSCRIASGPIWTGGGARILFLEVPPDKSALLVREISADGGELRTIHRAQCSADVLEDIVDDDDPGKRRWLRASLCSSRPLLAFELPAAHDGASTCILNTATGKRQALLRDLMRPEWAPDGSTLACVRLGVEKKSRNEVVLLSHEGEQLQQRAAVAFGDDVGHEGWGVGWAPDSRRLLVDCRKAVWLVHADGSRPAERVVEGMAPSFSPSGRQFYVVRGDGKDEFRPAMRDLSSGKETLLGPASETVWPAISPIRWHPDGKSYAAVWATGEEVQPLLQVVENGQPRWLCQSIASWLSIAHSQEEQAEDLWQDKGDLPAATRMYERVLSTYDGLLAAKPNWRWRLPVEIRCELMRQVLTGRSRDVGELKARVAALKEPELAEACPQMLFTLLLAQGRREHALDLASAYDEVIDEKDVKRVRELAELQAQIDREPKADLLLSLGSALEELLDFAGARGAYQQAGRTAAAGSDVQSKAADAIKKFGKQRLAKLDKLLGEVYRDLDAECPIGANVFWGKSSPIQAAGPPDAFGASAAAWRPPADEGTHWLETLYDPPSRADALSIVQSPVPGCVVAIDVVDVQDKHHRIWDRSDVQALSRLDIPPALGEIRSVKTHMYSQRGSRNTGIDAVCLHTERGDRWASWARASHRMRMPLPQVPASQTGAVTSPYQRFGLTLTSIVGEHRVESDTGEVRLPQGAYYLNRCEAVATDDDGATWEIEGSPSPECPMVRVAPGKRTPIDFDFPLTASPLVSRGGDKLRINVVLVGAQNRVHYHLSDLNRRGKKEPRPVFRVSDSNGQPIGEGKMEYG